MFFVCTPRVPTGSQSVVAERRVIDERSHHAPAVLHEVCTSSGRSCARGVPGPAPGAKRGSQRDRDHARSGASNAKFGAAKFGAANARAGRNGDEYAA